MEEKQLIGGRYRLIALLGVGGMGETYRAWDTLASIPVVVKMPKQDRLHDEDSISRFRREIEAMRSLTHESIVPITDSGEHHGRPFVVMRFLPGGSLGDYRRRDAAGNPIQNPAGMLHFWLPGVAAALDHIHAKGMLHRDVKPGNIFLDGFLRPFLGDFGIAKVVDDSASLPKEQTLTATGTAVGTLEYMAPELFRPKPKVDGSVDQYALAVTVYELICGEKPFTGSTAHVIVEHSSLAVPPLQRRRSGLPRSLCEAVHRSLAKRATERFATCSEFAAAALADLPALEPESDTVRLLCPSCRNILKLSQRTAGKRGQCPKCRATMDVAEDLGSLWLESEEQGGGRSAQGPAEEHAEVLFEKSEPQQLSTRTPPRWTWPAIATAAVSGLLVGVLWGNAGRTAAVKRELGEFAARAAEASTVARQDAQRRHAEEMSRIQMERDEALSAVASATRTIEGLEAKLAASTAIPAEKTPPQPVAKSNGLVVNSIGMQLRLIPVGDFLMGDDQGQDDEKPAHRVTITKSFLMGIHEVTNADWKHVMGTSSGHWQDDNRPVDSLTWDDAVTFCRKLSELPEEQTAGRSYRLPTEAEWEYACRAGTTTKFSFGDTSTLLGDFAWFVTNSGEQTHPVGQKKPNRWGLYDMHGNVWEWCGDWYGRYGGEQLTDPQGPAAGSARVVRGGAWNGPPENRRAYRFDGPSSSRSYDIGLRVVVSPEKDGTVQLAAVAAPRPNSPPRPPDLGVAEASGKQEQAAKSVGGNRQVTNSIGIQFSLIPPGEFTMGDDRGADNEKPAHRVTISKPFYLGIHEVTAEQWNRVMGTAPSSQRGGDTPCAATWEDWRVFCRKLSSLPSEQQAGRVYRAPTEAEWEYACRAGTTTPYSCGDSESLLSEYGWFGEKDVHPVGQKRPNAWGLFDMHGNAMEWVQDSYGPYPSAAVVDPTGPTTVAESGVARSGAYHAAATSCRSTSRFAYARTSSYLAGIRLAMTVPADASGQQHAVAKEIRDDPGFLTSFRDAVGTTVAFRVTGATTGSSIWGSNPYTADSRLSTAAVHAGVLRPGEAGVVRVTILPGQQSYVGSSRNGVAARSYGFFSLSYRIEGGQGAIPVPSGPTPGNLSQMHASVGQTLTFNIVGSVTNGAVWGSNPYTADSHLARAAVHAGVLRPGESGAVLVTILPGLSGYAGTTRNGVTSSSYSRYPLSYRLARARAGAGGPASVIPDPGTAYQYRESLGQTFTFQVIGLVGGGVWGSNPYTADSRLAAAAVHAGVLKPGESGVIRVSIVPGLQSYPGSMRNGVTSGSWGSFSTSIRIDRGSP